MGHIKGMTTVRNAAKQAFEAMPEEFSGEYLTKVARLICRRPRAYSGTFFRRMREMRSEGLLNYKCTSIINSQYMKL